MGSDGKRMKIKLYNLAILTAIAAGVTAVQAASAQESGGARFHFSPNVWKMDEMHMPAAHASVSPHSVTSGNVPHGGGFLVPDRQFLESPPAAQAQTQVSAQPSFTQTSAQMTPPKANFNPSFGKAGNLAPPAIANLPPQATPPAAQSNPAKTLKPLNHVVQASKNVHGVLMSRKKHSPEGLVANAGKRIDSYSSGYVPGPFLPSACGDGQRTTASVYGKLMKK